MCGQTYTHTYIHTHTHTTTVTLSAHVRRGLTTKKFLNHDNIMSASREYLIPTYNKNEKTCKNERRNRDDAAKKANTVESLELGRRLSGPAVLLGHFTWNGITSVLRVPVNWAKYSVYWAKNSEPHVDMSKMSKRTDLSIAKKIALLYNELHAAFHRPVVSLCAVKGTSQRLLECLHVSCSARFQDESVLDQICLGNRVWPHANPGQV